MNAGRVSSAALMLSGVAAVVNPQGVADALHLTAGDGRGVTETRAGLGGTYAALGGWALVSGEPAADVAVGVTWLGAAVVRVAALRVDRPSATASYWVYLGLEVACGTVSLVSAVTRRRAPSTGRLAPVNAEHPGYVEHPGDRDPPEFPQSRDRPRYSPGTAHQHPPG